MPGLRERLRSDGRDVRTAECLTNDADICMCGPRAAVPILRCGGYGIGCVKGYVPVRKGQRRRGRDVDHRHDQEPEAGNPRRRTGSSHSNSYTIRPGRFPGACLSASATGASQVGSAGRGPDRSCCMHRCERGAVAGASPRTAARARPAPPGSATGARPAR